VTCHESNHQREIPRVGRVDFLRHDGYNTKVRDKPSESVGNTLSIAIFIHSRSLSHDIQRDIDDRCLDDGHELCFCRACQYESPLLLDRPHLAWMSPARNCSDKPPSRSSSASLLTTSSLIFTVLSGAVPGAVFRKTLVLGFARRFSRAMAPSGLEISFSVHRRSLHRHRAIETVEREVLDPDAPLLPSWFTFDQRVMRDATRMLCTLHRRLQLGQKIIILMADMQDITTIKSMAQSCVKYK